MALDVGLWMIRRRMYSDWSNDTATADHARTWQVGTPVGKPVGKV